MHAVEPERVEDDYSCERAWGRRMHLCICVLVNGYRAAARSAGWPDTQQLVVTARGLQMLLLQYINLRGVRHPARRLDVFCVCRVRQRGE